MKAYLKSVIFGITLVLFSLNSHAFHPADKVTCAVKQVGAIEEILFLKGSVLGKREGGLDLVVYGELEGRKDAGAMFVKSSSCVSQRYSIRRDLVVVDLTGRPVIDKGQTVQKVTPSEAVISKNSDNEEDELKKMAKEEPKVKAPEKEGKKPEVDPEEDVVMTISDSSDGSVASDITNLFFKKKKEKKDE